MNATTILIVLAAWLALGLAFALLIGPSMAEPRSDDEQAAEADQFMGWVS